MCYFHSSTTRNPYIPSSHSEHQTRGKMIVCLTCTQIIDWSFRFCWDFYLFFVFFFVVRHSLCFLRSRHLLIIEFSSNILKTELFIWMDFRALLTTPCPATWCVISMRDVPLLSTCGAQILKCRYLHVVSWLTIYKYWLVVS